MLSSMFPFGNTSKIARGEESIGQRPFDPESGSSAFLSQVTGWRAPLPGTFAKGHYSVSTVGAAELLNVAVSIRLMLGSLPKSPEDFLSVDEALSIFRYWGLR
jgi:hypothetical protein